jgi:tetratricopeptide (TPR) repeat protein
MAATARLLRLRCSSWEQLAGIYERDVRRNVLFLKTTRPPALGTEMTVELVLPSGTIIPLEGRVGRVVGAGEARGPGVELLLVGITASTRWLIETALRAAGLSLAEDKDEEISIHIEVEPAEEDEALLAQHEVVAALEAELRAFASMNPFQILGVGYDATDEQIREAFVTLTKKYHPDRVASLESERARAVSADLFVLVREAYRRVGDPVNRVKVKAQVGAARPPLPLPPDPMRASPPPPPVRVSFSSQSARQAPTNLSEDALFSDLGDLGDRQDERPLHLVENTVLEKASALLDGGRYDEAIAIYEDAIKRAPGDRGARAGRELAFGLRLVASGGDKTVAARHFEAALQLDPHDERAARELASIRRALTENRKGLLGKLLGKK